MLNNDRVGELLRQAREAKNFTQQDMAEIFHIERQSWAKIESGQNRLKIEYLAELPKILDKPITYFLDLPHELGLTNDETEVLRVYRQLKTPSSKQRALRWMRDWKEMVEDAIQEAKASYQIDD